MIQEPNLPPEEPVVWRDDLDDREVMVSIHCITYNHEGFIRDALEGFVKQKTNFRFEAIVHDDASTDGTAAIIREYAEKYPSIIKPILETENQYSKHDGSLDRIMEAHIRGKYVAYCEGDDYWTDPLKLQKQVDFLESHPDYSMCFHNHIKLEPEKGFCDSGLTLQKKEYFFDDFVNCYLAQTATLLVRRSVYDSEYFKNPLRANLICGDEVLVLSCCKSGRVYCIDDKPMSVYRIHSAGISNLIHHYVEVNANCRYTLGKIFGGSAWIMGRRIYSDCYFSIFYKAALKSDIQKLSFAFKKLRSIWYYVPISLLRFIKRKILRK